MKKRYWMIALGLLLAITMSVPALATTCIVVDGKEYIFYGDQSVYEADGKTFMIGKDSVTILEEGKSNRVFPMDTSSDTASGTAGGIVAESSTMSQSASSMAAIYAEACAVEDVAISTTVVEGSGDIRNTAARFGVYAKYGLSFDAEDNTLYYQGKRVRIFEDTYPLDQNAVSVMEHFDASGTIDIEAVRDLSKRKPNADGSYDPSGELTGLRSITGAEFSSRDLSQWTNPPVQQATAVDGGTPMTPQEKKAFYAPYASFGLTYDEASDTLFYQGQSVRRFLDVQKSNGEPFSNGRFRGTMTHIVNDSGAIDVTTIRDYEKPDAEGNGTLIGMKIDQGE